MPGKAADVNEDSGQPVKYDSTQDMVLFDQVFQKVRTELVTLLDGTLSNVSDWIDKVVMYNVPHGKKNRGKSVVTAYRLLVENPTAANLEIAAIIGWCIELEQAYFLIHDDMMDHSLTRRGQPCWYLNEGVAEIAINDGCLLHSGASQLLIKFCKHLPHYTNILELFLDTVRYTQYGQCLDILTSSGVRPKFELFTRERHAAIVKYKTAFYTIDLPVRAAMYLAGIDDPVVHKEAQKVLIEIGDYFQVQDDFLDCFADPKVLGKVGTDIEEGKCSWLAVQAYASFTPEQKKIFETHYGINDPSSVSKIKDLYREVKLEQAFQNFEENFCASIREEIFKFSQKSGLNPNVFHAVLQSLYRRQK